jgi:RNA polymerase sigma-70 factor (ECF subfamily)
MKDPLALKVSIGDEQAYELLFRKLNVRLCLFANKFLQDPDEAQDVVQEAFIRVWENRRDLDPDDSISAYIFRIVQNLCLNRLRKRKIEQGYSEVLRMVYLESSVFSAHELYVAEELEEHIALAIRELPDGCRKIFTLSRHEGLKYKDIARVLDISPKTVEVQMSKALRLLRLKLSLYLTILILILLVLVAV